MDANYIFLVIIFTLLAGAGFRKLKLEVEALEHKLNALKHEVEILSNKTK